MEKRADVKVLAEVVKEARDLATRCFGVELTGPCYTLRYAEESEKKTVSCLQREEKRGARKFTPFDKYDPDKLCPVCLAYWRVELAAQALAWLLRGEQEIAAEEERKPVEVA